MYKIKGSMAVTSSIFLGINFCEFCETQFQGYINLWAMALPIHVVVMHISYFNDHLILWISSTTKVGA